MEKQWRITVPGKPARAAAVSASASRVWTTTACLLPPRSRAGDRRGHAGRGAVRDRESSRDPSPRPRRPADGAEARRARRTGCLRAARLMRVDPEGGVDALVGRGDRERGAARGDARPDRDDARDANRARPFDEECGGLVATVEMRVGVDHRGSGYAAGSSRRGKSGGAASIPCVSAVSPYATSDQSNAAGCCSADRIAAAVSGTYADSATATARRPSTRS